MAEMSSRVPERSRGGERAGDGAGAAPPAAPSGARLSPREVAVLQHAAAGTPVREIAAALDLSPNTVKSYLRLAAAKLGAGGRAEALRRAAAAGLVPAAPRPAARSALLDEVLRLAAAAGALPAAPGHFRERPTR